MFIRQFASPLIYVLVAAAAVSVAIGHGTDAAFIFVVLLINAVIGAAQEYAAQRSAGTRCRSWCRSARVIRAAQALSVTDSVAYQGDVVA